MLLIPSRTSIGNELTKEGCLMYYVSLYSMYFIFHLYIVFGNANYLFVEYILCMYCY